MLDILQSIAMQLKKIYASKEIFLERVKQDAPNEYFKVRLVTSQLARLQGTRREVRVTVDLAYRALSYSALETVGYRILEEFEYLETPDGLLRSSSVSQNITDYELHTIMTFKFYVHVPLPDATKMGQINTQFRRFTDG